MNSWPNILDRESTHAALGVALREAHGADARLEGWAADPLMKRGKHRVVRYEIYARVPGVPGIRRCYWVGKFYDREEVAARVERTLRELSLSGCSVRGGFLIPAVVGHDASGRLVF